MGCYTVNIYNINFTRGIVIHIFSIYGLYTNIYSLIISAIYILYYNWGIRILTGDL